MEPDPGKAPIEIPATLTARYRAIRRLGRGGFGEVLLADDLELGRPVALKLIGAAGLDAGAAARVRREIRHTAGIRHAHVVEIYDGGLVEGGGAWIAYRFVDGPTLEAELAAGPLPVAAVARLGAALADALATLHQGGVIHRDVKPANVMLSGAERTPLLCDFGLARPISGATFETSAGMVLGTPAYMAPELFSGDPATAASDQFSLGACLLEAWSGRLPWGSADLVEVLSAWRTGRLPPLPEPASPLGRVLVRALAFRPEDRFPDLDSLGTTLAPLAGLADAPPAPATLVAAPVAPVAPALRTATVRLPAAPVPAPERSWWRSPGAAAGLLGLLLVLGLGVRLVGDGLPAGTQGSDPGTGTVPGFPAEVTEAAARLDASLEALVRLHSGRDFSWGNDPGSHALEVQDGLLDPRLVPMVRRTVESLVEWRRARASSPGGEPPSLADGSPDQARMLSATCALPHLLGDVRRCRSRSYAANLEPDQAGAGTPRRSVPRHSGTAGLLQADHMVALDEKVFELERLAGEAVQDLRSVPGAVPVLQLVMESYLEANRAGVALTTAAARLHESLSRPRPAHEMRWLVETQVFLLQKAAADRSLREIACADLGQGWERVTEVTESRGGGGQDPILPVLVQLLEIGATWRSRCPGTGPGLAGADALERLFSLVERAGRHDPGSMTDTERRDLARRLGGILPVLGSGPDGAARLAEAVAALRSRIAPEEPGAGDDPDAGLDTLVARIAAWHGPIPRATLPDNDTHVMTHRDRLHDAVVGGDLEELAEALPSLAARLGSLDRKGPAYRAQEDRFRSAAAALLHLFDDLHRIDTLLVGQIAEGDALEKALELQTSKHRLEEARSLLARLLDRLLLVPGEPEAATRRLETTLGVVLGPPWRNEVMALVVRLPGNGPGRRVSRERMEDFVSLVYNHAHHAGKRTSPCPDLEHWIQSGEAWVLEGGEAQVDPSDASVLALNLFFARAKASSCLESTGGELARLLAVAEARLPEAATAVLSSSDLRVDLAARLRETVERLPVGAVDPPTRELAARLEARLRAGS